MEKKEKKRKSEWNLIFFVDTSVEFVWLTIKHGQAMWLICLFRNPQYQLYNNPWNYSSFHHCFIFRKGKANLPTISCIARSWKDEGLPLDILKTIPSPNSDIATIRFPKNNPGNQLRNVYVSFSHSCDVWQFYSDIVAWLPSI